MGAYFSPRPIHHKGGNEDNIEINSVDDFRELFVDQIEFTNPQDVGSCKFWYRGSARNYEDPFVPSVFREGEDRNEKMLYVSLKAQQPFEFREKELFDTLCLSQHYGLPTRLLDFTSCPYVALYLACARHDNQDGYVHIMGISEMSPDNEFVKYVCSLAEFFDGDATDQWTIAHLCDHLANRFHPQITISKFFEMMKCDWLAIDIARHNARSENQRGKFLLFGFYAVLADQDDAGRSDVDEDDTDIGDFRKDNQSLFAQELEQDLEELIGQELKELTEQEVVEQELRDIIKVFWDGNETEGKIEDQPLKKVAEYLLFHEELVNEEAIKSALSKGGDRLDVAGGIIKLEPYKTLSPERINEAGSRCLIKCIVPSKVKKRILQELEQLMGINDGFIFPPTLEERIDRIVKGEKGEEELWDSIMEGRRPAEEGHSEESE
jgi:hypothetical protein